MFFFNFYSIAIGESKGNSFELTPPLIFTQFIPFSYTIIFHVILQCVTNQPEAAALKSLLTNTCNYNCTIIIGARGGAVVEALRYKPEGRGIDSRCCYPNFSLA
jgi:hypothetical protein